MCWLCRRGKHPEQILDAPRSAGRKEILSRNIFQGKKYYLGILLLLCIQYSSHHSKTSTVSLTWCLFSGQLVQGGAVLQVPRDAPGQHQLRRGAEEPRGSHHQLRHGQRTFLEQRDRRWGGGEVSYHEDNLPITKYSVKTTQAISNPWSLSQKHRFLVLNL